MKSFLICTILLSNLFFCNPVDGQIFAEPDLTSVKLFLAENNYEESRTLIEIQLDTFPDNFYLHWLHAVATHHLGYSQISYQSYEKAIALSQSNHEIIMDYGRTLFNDGKYFSAIECFDFIINRMIYSGTYYEALVMKGYALSCLGDVKKSKQIMKSVLDEDSKLDYIRKFIQELDYTLAPYITLGVSYAADDQPLNMWKNSLDVGLVNSRFFNPMLNFTSYNMDTENSSSCFQIKFGNRLYLAKQRIKISVSLGAYQYFSNKENSWVGSLDVERPLWKNLSGKLFWERSPYLGTKYSAYNMLMQDQLGAALTYNSQQLFIMSARYARNLYENKNEVQSIGAWIVSRPIDLGISKWSFGYGLSYANAKKIDFFPIGDVEELLVKYPLGSQLPGIYSPYYTPSDELTHSLIADVGLKLPAGLNFSTKVIYGFYAEKNVPFLYSNLDQGGLHSYTTTSYRAKYNPFLLNASLDKKINKKLLMSFLYGRHNAFYYSQDKIELNLSFKFI